MFCDAFLKSKVKTAKFMTAGGIMTDSRGNGTTVCKIIRTSSTGLLVDCLLLFF